MYILEVTMIFNQKSSILFLGDFMAYSFKGNLSFGFVYIPITLHLIVKDSRVSFRLFDQKTKSKIQYKKTCIDCDGREVKNEDIIKGYEYEDGKFVMVSEDDFEKIKTTKDKNITIEQFINLSEVDPIYYDKSYFVVPTGAEKAYSLLVKAMKEEKKAGIGKTVLGTKESLILIRAQDNHLVLSTLFFQEEIKDYPHKEEKVTFQASELRLAKLLIKEMTDTFNPKLYHDEYAKKINKLIEMKIKGNKIIAPKEKKENHIRDLMDALQTSLNQFSNKKTKKGNSKKKGSSSLNIS